MKLCGAMPRRFAAALAALALLAAGCGEDEEAGTPPPRTAPAGVPDEAHDPPEQVPYRR